MVSTPRRVRPAAGHLTPPARRLDTTLLEADTIADAELAPDRARARTAGWPRRCRDAACLLVDADHGAEADWRRAVLLELYERGLTRREIAEQMGICPDWVRQLLRRYEVPAVPVRERRYRRAVAGRESQIIAAFLQLRSCRAVARRLGLREDDVQRLVDGAVPEAGVLSRARRTLEQTYTEAELLDALRQAALSAPSPLSIASYRCWASGAGHEIRRPGSEVFKLRFGGWRRALARAGLPTNLRSGPQAGYRYEDVVAAIAAAWRELGGYPSVTRYDAWRAGRAQLPVAATARRFAKSWDDLLVAAYPLVYPTVDGLAVGPRALDAVVPEARPAKPSRLVANPRPL